ncbi:MAG: tetratricopeptide repeat protein [Oscillospiraceae bacterium]|nr:tetratricopeptide repeat protein [Oscillospiraceae bacterium]
MNWFVLGIEPTKDKKVITAAYRQKLRETNPEDKPEEFKALRAAYEEALKLAEKQEAPKQFGSDPVGQWEKQLCELYGDFRRRIDPQQWRPLLEQELCQAPDTRLRVEETLLKFLMKHYRLPQRVWQLLDETFSFCDRREELYESYPRDFVDYAIISGVRNEPNLNYDLFRPGEDGEVCDQYYTLYLQIIQGSPDESGPLLEQLEALSEFHPYGKLIGYRNLISSGREAEGVEGIHALARSYPSDTGLLYASAELYLREGNVETAEPLLREILRMNPEHIYAGYGLAQCYGARGEYLEAKKLVYELIPQSAENLNLQAELHAKLQEWNEALIPILLQRWQEEPADTENGIQLAWAYMQNERIQEAEEIAQQLDPQRTKPCDYYNLYAKVLYRREKDEAALSHAIELERCIRSLTAQEDIEKWQKRLPEILQLQASCLMNLERQGEAKEKLEAALELDPHNTEQLCNMSKLLYAMGDYAYAAEIAQRQLRLEPESWTAERLLAVVYYRLHEDRAAIEAVDRALEYQRWDLDLYTIKAQILLRNQVWEGVHEILNFLEETGAPQDISVEYVRARLVEEEQQDKAKALKLYKQLLDRVEEGELLLWDSDLYFRVAKLSQTPEMDDAAVEELLQLLDRALEQDRLNEDCLRLKAKLLKDHDRYEEAVEMFLALREKDPDSLMILRSLGSLYYEKVKRYAPEALECFEQILERSPSPECCFFAANCKHYMGDLEGAAAFFRRELELDPDDIDGYNGMADIRETQGRYEEALEYLEQALQIMDSHGEFYDWIVEHKLRVLRRMGCWEQALSAAGAAIEHYDFPQGYELSFDICCQFGQWDRAEEVIKEWTKACKGDTAPLAARGKLLLMQGKMMKATLAMGTAKHRMTEEQVVDFRLLLAELEGNAVRQMSIWAQRVKADPVDDYALMHFAHALWRYGDVERAQKIAAKALKRLDAILERYRIDEALYRSRRSLVLAILGRGEEARQELSRTRDLSLCSFCPYGSCKDADVYEAMIEEILGDPKKALELCRKGREKWQDETDFAAIEAALKKKGVK